MITTIDTPCMFMFVKALKLWFDRFIWTPDWNLKCYKSKFLPLKREIFLSIASEEGWGVTSCPCHPLYTPINPPWTKNIILLLVTYILNLGVCRFEKNYGQSTNHRKISYTCEMEVVWRTDACIQLKFYAICNHQIYYLYYALKIKKICVKNNTSKNASKNIPSYLYLTFRHSYFSSKTFFIYILLQLTNILNQ